jgi:hypothetical protein
MGMFDPVLRCIFCERKFLQAVFGDIFVQMK